MRHTHETASPLGETHIIVQSRTEDPKLPKILRILGTEVVDYICEPEIRRTWITSTLERRQQEDVFWQKLSLKVGRKLIFRRRCRRLRRIKDGIDYSWDAPRILAPRYVAKAI